MTSLISIVELGTVKLANRGVLNWLIVNPKMIDSRVAGISQECMCNKGEQKSQIFKI